MWISRIPFPFYGVLVIVKTKIYCFVTLVIDNATGIYNKNATTKKAIVLVFYERVFECPACHTRKQKPGGTGYRGKARTGECVRGDELRKCSLINIFVFESPLTTLCQGSNKDDLGEKEQQKSTMHH